ncbi:DNA translocase FtsK 4TM domain-containing protein, partial [Roseobacter sp. HKCCA0434]|uniref:DNA translocase FtsK 4TM domain-containing protein n=1 Tax=Roseobacter sp. HKCCA0434 TaxID=3079297 RepID=UPI002905AFC9
MTIFTTGRARDPFMPSRMQAALGQGVGRLIGAGLLAAALAVAALLWTWSADDPSFFNAVDRAPGNALGYVGATLAEVLIRAIGWAAWVLPAALAVWGVRLVMRRGEARFLTGLILLLPMIALTAIFAAMHVPPTRWLPSYGLGGLFGDGVGGVLLSLLPLDAGLALPLVAVASGLALLLVGFFGFGLDRAEGAALRRYVLSGLGTSGATVAGIAGAAWRGVTALRGRV